MRMPGTYETSASNQLVMQHLNEKRRRTTLFIVITVTSLILLGVVATFAVLKSNRECFSVSVFFCFLISSCLLVLRQPALHETESTGSLSTSVKKDERQSSSTSSVIHTTGSIETVTEVTTQRDTSITGEDKTWHTSTETTETTEKEDETEETFDWTSSESDSSEWTEEIFTQTEETHTDPPGSLPYLISEAHSKSDALSRDLNSLHETINEFQWKFQDIQAKINSLQVLLEQVKNITVS